MISHNVPRKSVLAYLNLITRTSGWFSSLNAAEALHATATISTFNDPLVQVLYPSATYVVQYAEPARAGKSRSGTTPRINEYILVCDDTGVIAKLLRDTARGTRDLIVKWFRKDMTGMEYATILVADIRAAVSGYKERPTPTKLSKLSDLADSIDVLLEYHGDTLFDFVASNDCVDELTMILNRQLIYKTKRDTDAILLQLRNFLDDVDNKPVFFDQQGLPVGIDPPRPPKSFMRRLWDKMTKSYK
jgi:hypothetical protein